MGTQTVSNATNMLPLAGGTMSGDIIFGNGIRLEYSSTHWITPRDTSGNMHLSTTTGGIYLDSPVIYIREKGSESNKITIDNGTLTATGTISASNFSGTSSGTNTGDQTSVSGNAGTVTNGVYTNTNQTISGIKTFSGGHGAINITNSSILSSATSTWTGDPGGAGKIQYHSNRWYIVSDSSSNRIVQFRRDGSDKSYIDNNGTFVGSVSGNATTATTASNSNLLDNLDSTQFLRSDATDTMSGVLTINHTNDNQLLLTSPSSWTGIGFNDSASAATDYIWHNGTHQTFAIGGGGSNISGKKLHIHGGATIGSGYAATAVDSNGLYVQGNVRSAGTGRFASYVATDTSQSRSKIRLWDVDTNYAIGFKNGYDFGHIGNSSGTGDEYAVSFLTNDNNARGVWWGKDTHSDNQGAMAVTADGRLNVAKSVSIGEGESVVNPSSTPLYVKGTVAGSTVFDVQGTQGQLFSITDDLTGDLFSVSDISGIPILTVNSLGVVTIDDTLRVTGDVIAYSSSDSRLKDNVTPISNPLDKLKMIGGYEFDWNGLSKNNGHDVGVIAQEIESVLPELVETRGDGFKGVQYDKLTALLIEAVKEQQIQIDELKSKLNK